MGPDDQTLPRRSVAEFYSLRRPLDHLGFRYYRPQHLTADQLQTLIQPLLSEHTGRAYPASSEHAAGQGAARPGGTPILAVRDRLENLDRLDQVVPLLDMAPTYVLFDGMVLVVRLSGGGRLDLHRLAQKGHLTPAEHARRGPVKAVPSSDADGLKVAYLHGDINGLLEAIGAFGVATLTGTPRVAVRQGADAEVELEADSVTPSRHPEPPSAASAVPATGLRLFLRPVAVYEGGMDVEVRTLIAPSPTAIHTERSLAQRLGNEEPLTRAREKTVSVVVPEGVTLVIGGLVQPNTASQTLPDRPSFLGIKPFWGRPAADRQELLVLIAARQGGTPSSEATKAIEALGPAVRRTVAQQYLRAAQRAEAARQPALARQWAELALRFDGSEPAAMELYDRLQKSALMAPRTALR